MEFSRVLPLSSTKSPSPLIIWVILTVAHIMLRVRALQAVLAAEHLWRETLFSMGVPSQSNRARANPREAAFR